MQKIFLLVFPLFIAFNSFAQNTDSVYTYTAPAPRPVKEKRPMPTTIIRINPFGFFGGNFHGEFEKVVSKKVSVQLGFGYRYYNINSINALFDSTLSNSQDKVIQSGFTIIPQVKYYWTSFSRKLKVPTGSYIAPFARIGLYDIDFMDNDSNLHQDASFKRTTIAGGFVVGFQLLAGRIFAVDAFLGPQFKQVRVHDIKYKNPTNNRTNPLNFKEQTDFVPGIRFGISIGIGVQQGM